MRLRLPFSMDSLINILMCHQAIKNKLAHIIQQSIMRKKEKYEFLGQVGAGEYGKVLKVREVNSGKYLACKRADVGAMPFLISCLREIQIMRIFHHPNAIQYYDHQIFEDEDGENIEIRLYMELASMNLQEDASSRARDSNYYSLQQLLNIIKSTVSCLSKMQTLGLLHRDIKPSNILIVQKGGQKVYKIADMGFAILKQLYRGGSIAGTGGFASPRIRRKFIDEKVEIAGNNTKDDVYSLGVTLLFLCHLGYRLPNTNCVEMVRNSYNEEIYTIIKDMLAIDERMRPTFKQLEARMKKYEGKGQKLTERQQADRQILEVRVDKGQIQKGG